MLIAYQDRQKMSMKNCGSGRRCQAKRDKKGVNSDNTTSIYGMSAELENGKKRQVKDVMEVIE